MSMETVAVDSTGYCQCGCGKTTPLATRTRNGYRKGEHVRYLRGHTPKQSRHNIEWEVQDRGYETRCWISKNRYVDDLGYARINHPLGTVAHVVMYRIYKGNYADGLVLDHLCRNPSCINPDHLEPITHQENVRRGQSAKLTRDQAFDIKYSDESGYKLADRYGISRTQVYNIKKGISWSDL